MGSAQRSDWSPNCLSTSLIRSSQWLFLYHCWLLQEHIISISAPTEHLNSIFLGLLCFYITRGSPTVSVSLFPPCFSSLSLISRLNKPPVSCPLSPPFSPFACPPLFHWQLFLLWSFLPPLSLLIFSSHPVVTLKANFWWLAVQLWFQHDRVLVYAAVVIARTGSAAWLGGQLGRKLMELQDAANWMVPVGLGVDGRGVDEDYPLVSLSNIQIRSMSTVNYFSASECSLTQNELCIIVCLINWEQ